MELTHHEKRLLKEVVDAWRHTEGEFTTDPRVWGRDYLEPNEATETRHIPKGLMLLKEAMNGLNEKFGFKLFEI